MENKKDKIMESMTSNLGHCDRNEGKSWEWIKSEYGEKMGNRNKSGLR